MIGVVTTSYPRFPGDFAGVFVATRVRRLREAGARVHVIAAGPAAAEESQTRIASRLFYGAGAPELIESGGAWFAAVTFTLRQAAAIAAQRKHLHAIESHWLVPSGLAAALCAPELPHRAFVHSGDLALLERMPAWFGTSIARLVVAQAQEIVCVSRDLRVRLEHLLGRRRPRTPIVVQRLQVDPAAGSGRAPMVSGGEKTILGIGRLVPIKGFDVLIHAVGRIPARRRPRVRILGEGPERTRLARVARACDVRLDLPGTVDHRDVAAALADADVCAVPSRNLPNGRSEGLPQAALEALAAGVPLVASAVGGLPELPATLVPPDDADALARALDAVLHRLFAPRAGF